MKSLRPLKNIFQESVNELQHGEKGVRQNSYVYIHNVMHMATKNDLLMYVRSIEPDEELVDNIEEAMTEARKHRLKDVKL